MSNKDRDRKKSGFVIESDYEVPNYIFNFSNICTVIDKEINYKNNIIIINEKILAKITYQLQYFMEKTCGRSVALEKRYLTKIPNSLFKDYSVGGSLYVILLTSIQFQINKGWESFQIKNEISRHDDGCQLLIDIEQKLVENGLLKRPKVFINNVPDIDSIRDKVISHKGIIVSSIEEASHIIDWDEEVDNLPSELANEYIRTLDLRPNAHSGIAFVHWWYHPDSYDEWIPSDDVDESEPPDLISNVEGRQWRVSCRFIDDCDRFNEWMSEIDYEIHEKEDDDMDVIGDVNNVDEPVIRAGKLIIRSSLINKKSKKKKKNIPIPGSIIVTEKILNTYNPPSYDNRRSYVTVMDLNYSNEINKISKVNIIKDNNVIITNSKRKNHGKFEVNNDDNNKNDIFKSNLHKIPQWFDNDNVTEIEIKYLSSLLLDINNNRIEKQIENYLMIRKFIIDLYLQNSSVYLSATDCRRKISGDCCEIMKYHEFLDSFGIINFLVRPDLKQMYSLNISSSQLDMTSLINTEIVKINESDNIITFDNKLSSTKSNSNSNKMNWTIEMDTKLKESVLEYELDWKLVANSMDNNGGITPADCYARFIELPLEFDFNSNNANNDNIQQEENIHLNKRINEELLTPSVYYNMSNNVSIAQRLKLFGCVMMRTAVSSIGIDKCNRIIKVALNMIKENQITNTEESKNLIDMNVDEVSNCSNNSFIDINNISAKLDYMEQKIKNILDVENVIDIERERIGVEVSSLLILNSNLVNERNIPKVESIN